MTRKQNGAAGPAAKRCAIYTRKSTSMGLEQEFNSLDAQREACEQYIAARGAEGWRLAPARYDDGGFTGANIERPAFQQLLVDVDAGNIDVVVVYKVDRLSRSLLDFAQVMNRFNNADVAFVSVTQNFSTADAMGRLTLNMLMSFAEFERAMIAERTRDKIAASRRRGKWTGGPVPLGYDVVDKKLVVNELEGIVVREIFSLYEQHGSALTVAGLLNEAGRSTKRHRAKNGNVRAGRRWTKDAVLRVLRNPVYAGYMPYGDELHQADHDAIIDSEQFRRIRAMLEARRGRKKSRARNPEYLLRGILRCGRCGMAMTPASTRKKGTEYRYYRCVNRDKNGRKACKSRPLPADAIEAFIVERIREATAGGTLADDVQKQLRARIEGDRSALKTERRDLPARIAKLSAEGRRLVEKIGEVAGAASSLINQRIEEVGAELGRHQARLAEVEYGMAALDQAEIEARHVVEALANFDEVWELLTTANRGRLVRALVRSVEIDEPTGAVTAVLTDIDLEDVAGGRAIGAPTRVTCESAAEATA